MSIFVLIYVGGSCVIHYPIVHAWLAILCSCLFLVYDVACTFDCAMLSPTIINLSLKKNNYKFGDTYNVLCVL